MFDRLDRDLPQSRPVTVTRARRLVLERLGIHWVEATVEEAATVLTSA